MHTQSSPFWSSSSFQPRGFHGRCQKSSLQLTSLRSSCISNSPWAGSLQLDLVATRLSLSLSLSSNSSSGINSKSTSFGLWLSSTPELKELRNNRKENTSTSSVSLGCSLPWICASKCRLPSRSSSSYETTAKKTLPQILFL
jgi:hypothetical protein